MIPTGILLNILRTASSKERRWGGTPNRPQSLSALSLVNCYFLTSVTCCMMFTLFRIVSCTYLVDSYHRCTYWCRLTLHNPPCKILCNHKTAAPAFFFFNHLCFAFSLRPLQLCYQILCGAIHLAPPPKRNITWYHIDLGIQLRWHITTFHSFLLVPRSCYSMAFQALYQCPYLTNANSYRFKTSLALSG